MIRAIGQKWCFTSRRCRPRVRVSSVFWQRVHLKSVDIFSLGEIDKKFKVDYLRNANPQYHALPRDCSPRRPLPGDDVILPRPLPVCMQMRSKGKILRSNISGTERDRRKILSPHDPSPQPLQIPPYRLYLRFRVWGSEPQNPKFTFFDPDFLFVSNFFYKSFYGKRVRVSSG